MSHLRILIGLITLLAATAASATTMIYDSRTVLQFSNLGRAKAVTTATGLVKLNGSGTGLHLNTMEVLVAPGSINTAIPVTDPIVTAGGIVEVRLTSVKAIDGFLGVFAPISGALQNTANQLTMNTQPSQGSVRICLFYAGCNSGSIENALGQTVNGVPIGAGVGGVITIGGSGAIRISILGAPWTIKTASVSNRTDNGVLTYFQRNGFAHGPASLTSSTAQPSGVLQLVNATQTTVVGVPGNGDLSGQLSSARYHFVPEPGLLLLLGSGAAGLAILGRRRTKR